VHGDANRGTMTTVKFRIATAAAFAAGFALGSRSHRTRLSVVTADGSTARPRGAGRAVPAKARAVVVLGAVRARDAVGVRLGWRDGDEAADAIVIEMAGDLASAINGRSTLAG
jgi:hypothetical protein